MKKYSPYLKRNGDEDSSETGTQGRVALLEAEINGRVEERKMASQI